MYACVVLFICILLSCCTGVTVHRYSQPDIKSKNTVEIPAVIVPCALSDIIIISAPIVKDAVYYLHNPSGDATILNITRPKYPEPKGNEVNNDYEDIIIKNTKNVMSITPLDNYKVFSLNSNVWETADIFAEYSKNLSSNDFIIGPLVEENHGNWVLSAYIKGEDGEWTEVFQVITIMIKEYIEPTPRIAKLHRGATLAFSFAHALPNISSCELTAPRSTFDRFYERDHIKMDTCGYIIRNITKHDQGTWRITAVGNIVYGTQLHLKVLDCHECKSEILYK